MKEAAAALTDTVGLIPPQSVELGRGRARRPDARKGRRDRNTGDHHSRAFFKEAHQIIYKAIMELSMELKPIDLYTVTEKLKQTRKLSAVGGAAYRAD